MAFFPRAFVDSDVASFTPLFRLLDDFDTYSRGSGDGGQHQRRGHTKTFQPRFDVKELPHAYELHGELPGIDQKDIEIEFTDPQTLTIRGRIERTYTSGAPPSNLVEGQKSSGAITEGGEQQQQQQQQEQQQQSRKATVEEEGEAKDKDKEGKSTEVTTTDQQGQQVQQQQEQAKYWVSERTVGEFARSFSFPGRVDQDGVKATMNNGILSILVPKAKKHETRKINIS